MFNIKNFNSIKNVPFTEFTITTDGVLKLNGDESNLETFNKVTKFNVKGIKELVAITYHDFNWPPSYWHHLIAREFKEGYISPENFVLGIDNPVESLEYPNFYMIPYYSNYVISKEGVCIRRDGNYEVQASENSAEYFTFRMKDDSQNTANRYRHRILLMTFKVYPVKMETLMGNHINGIKGEDNLDNLEWVTSKENNNHAQDIGLMYSKSGGSYIPPELDAVDIQVRDIVTGHVMLFDSCVSAANATELKPISVLHYLKTNGYNDCAGFQFRKHPNKTPWPEVEQKGAYIVTLDSGKEIQCGSETAARLMGLTRTSLMRAMREGRFKAKNGNKIRRVKS